MPRKPSNTDSPPVYGTKPLRPHVDDSYRRRGKYAEPTACPECNAVFHDGRWQWMALPQEPQYELCPACHRIHDDAPAGYVRLEGAFLADHRGELLALVHNVEAREKAERPLNRIMAITEDDGSLLVTTTDSHLARDIGKAVHHAYQGSLKIQYSEDENLARVAWKR